MQVTVTQFQNGTAADANAVNADLNALANAINGNIAADNITDGSITDAELAASISPITFRKEATVNYVVSGLTIATSASLSSTILAGVAYINGKRVVFSNTALTVAASKDSYIDILDDGSVAKVPVNNNVTSGMTLSTNTDGSKALRIARVIADGTAIKQVMQGTHVTTGFVAPNTLGNFGFDAIGNPIYNTDPTGRTLGYCELTTSFSTTSTSLVDTGLTLTVQVPAGRRIAISAKSNVVVGTTGGYAVLALLEDGTQIDEASPQSSATNQQLAPNLTLKRTPTAGSHIYKIQTKQTAVSGGITLPASPATRPILTVELS